MKKQLIISALFSICFLIPVSAQDQDPTTYTKKGQKVPDFSFETLDGEKMNISNLKGKVVLINFFATWCGPCMKEMPHLEADVWKAFKDRDFIVIAIGREHSKEELVTFNKEKGFTFRIAPDPERKIFSLFAEKSIPRNYLIGKEGRIIYQGIGYNEKEFEALKDLIKTSLD